MRPENRQKEVPTERFLAENRSRRFKALRDRDASTEISASCIETHPVERAV